MLIHLLLSSPFDAAIWLFVGVCQLLAVLAYHRGELRRHRAFALYLHFALLSTVVMMAWRAGPNAWISRPSALIQMGLLAFAVVELYQNTIGPRRALTNRIIRNLSRWLALAATASALMSVLCLPRFGGGIIRILGAAEEFAVVAVALAIWVLLWQARRLCHNWLPRDAQIAGGCALMLSFGSVAIGLMFTQGPSIGWAAFRISELANILSFGWWAYALLQPEARLSVPTDEELASAIQMNQESAHTLATVETALGQVVE